MSRLSRPAGSTQLRSPDAEAGRGGWPFHGIRLLILLGLAAITTFLFPPDSRLRMEQYGVGTIADADVIAEIQFSVPVGPEELDRARTEARAAVPPTLEYHPAAADSTAANLNRFFQRLEAAAERGEDAVTEVLGDRSIATTPSQVRLLMDQEVLQQIQRAALRATREILSTGVADGSDLAGVTTSRVTIRDPDGGTERSVDREVVLSAREFLDRAVSLLPASLPPDAQEILRLIFIQHMEYTYRLNVAATELDRDGAARAVPTVRQTVLSGEAIVRGNEQITPASLERLAAYQSALRSQGLLDETVELSLSPVAGAGLLNFIILGVFGTFIFFFRREVYDQTRWVVLVGILVAVYLGGAAVVTHSGWPVEALPVVFSALAVAVLWDGRMALVLAMVLAVLSAVQTGLQGTSVLIPTFVGGAAAGMSVRVVRRRAQTWIFIALIFVAYSAAILALSLVYSRGVDELGISLLAAGANSIVSAILAMGFLPVFEWATRITTDQTLLEWGDPNRALLRRLSMEAPGTYAHTINVANLAEAAATAIEANGLLCRVGLYYHDVGKMLKPHYFVENQPDGRNPHDRLKPDTSAAIIREHITEGYELARDEGVPDVIADFILEHHGTQRIGFFYERAVEEYGEEAVDPAEYSYPGPRPRSRETAIAMLADSVESATRVLQEPSPERIRDLIDSVVEAKISSGQLDDAPLTFREVTRIKEQFVKVLGGVYHHRIDYPQTKHLTEAARDGEDGPPEETDPGSSPTDPATSPTDPPTGEPPRSRRRKRTSSQEAPELPLGDLDDAEKDAVTGQGHQDGGTPPREPDEERNGG